MAAADEAIADRIVRVARKVRERDVRLGGRTAEAALAAFERRHDVVLPEAYRAFLLEVGNGGRGPPTGGWLALGNLPSSGLSEDEVSIWSAPSRIRHPFPFTRPWVWEDGDPSDEGTREQIEHGSVLLGDDGCGQYWVLIVTGPDRGNVWMLCDVGIQPTAPKRDFLRWYEDWLDGTRDWWE